MGEGTRSLPLDLPRLSWVAESKATAGHPIFQCVLSAFGPRSSETFFCQPVCYDRNSAIFLAQGLLAGSESSDRSEEVARMGLECFFSSLSPFFGKLVASPASDSWYLEFLDLPTCHLQSGYIWLMRRARY